MATGGRPTKTGKYNFPALRREFVLSGPMTLKDFLKLKGLPLYYTNSKHFSGAVTEKHEYQTKVMEEASNRRIDEDIEDAVKIRRRQARLARFMQLKGAEALKDSNLRVQTADEARKLLQSGLEQERKALGMEGSDKPNSLTQININTGPKTQLDRLVENASYEDILGIIAELKRGREGSATQEVIEGSATETKGEV